MAQTHVVRVNEPPTDPQVDLIARLINERAAKRLDGTYVADVTVAEATNVENLMNKVRGGTRLQASEWIDRLMKAPKVKKVSTASIAEVGHTLVHGGPAAPHVEDGYYAVDSATGTNDLDFYRVRTRKSGKWEGHSFVDRVIGGPRIVKITREEASEARVRIAAAGPLSAAAIFGREFKQCGRCGRPLTDELSRARGIGPDCWTREGWSYDDTDVLDKLLHDSDVVGEEEA